MIISLFDTRLRKEIIIMNDYMFIYRRLNNFKLIGYPNLDFVDYVYKKN